MRAPFFGLTDSPTPFYIHFQAVFGKICFLTFCSLLLLGIGEIPSLTAEYSTVIMKKEYSFVAVCYEETGGRSVGRYFFRQVSTFVLSNCYTIILSYVGI